MRTQSYLLGAAAIALALSGASYAAYLSFVQKPTPQIVINSFESCAEAGFPILETYPERCSTADGRTFTKTELSETPAIPIVATSSGVNAAQEAGDMVQVLSPAPNEKLISPLSINGRARGNWYFEASFPIELTDTNGKVIAKGHGQAQGDWMTTEFVPFTANLTWASTTATSGVLIFKRDNPSGIPENDASFSLPVNF